MENTDQNERYSVQTYFEKRRDEIDAQFDRSDALRELSKKTISKMEELQRDQMKRQRFMQEAVSK